MKKTYFQKNPMGTPQEDAAPAKCGAEKWVTDGLDCLIFVCSFAGLARSAARSGARPPAKKKAHATFRKIGKQKQKL